MGISLLDCIDPDGKKACEKIYHKITSKAKNLVPVVDAIAREYGIPHRQQAHQRDAGVDAAGRSARRRHLWITPRR